MVGDEDRFVVVDLEMPLAATGQPPQHDLSAIKTFNLFKDLGFTRRAGKAQVREPGRNLIPLPKFAVDLVKHRVQIGPREIFPVVWQVNQGHFPDLN